MEFKHMEYFIETCGHKSMSQAAEALFISQQALSRCIQNMEQELGCKLFQRTVKGSILTEEGRYVYEQFNPIVQSYRNTLSQTVAHLERRPQKVTFACGHLIFGVLDTQLLFDFQEENPDITLERLERTDRDVDSYVAAHESHLGLLALPENRHGQRFDYVPVKTLPLRLYIHKDHPLAQCANMEFSMLKDESFLAMENQSHYHSILRDKAGACGFTPKISYESADISELYKLVDRGKGVFMGIDSATVAERFPNIRMVPFTDETLTYCIGFIFQSYDSLSAPAKKFISFIVEHTV